jgi:hypothetical protein
MFEDANVVGEMDEVIEARPRCCHDTVWAVLLRTWSVNAAY